MLPDRPVFLDLLVDLGNERLCDRRRRLLVVELTDGEVEPHLRRLVVDGGGGRDIERVDMPENHTAENPGPWLYTSMRPQVVPRA